MRSLFAAFLIMIFFPGFCLANICTQLPGSWEGQWEDQQHRLFNAQLELRRQGDHMHFDGQFTLSDGSAGTLQGKCLPVSAKEAYLSLRKDAPWYNPCRGTVLQVDKIFMIHFYCFSPNQSGYFTLK